MMGRTHMQFGLLAGLVGFSIAHQPWYTFIPLAVLGSLLPDVDHENSKINRMMPLTRWIPTLFKHRGFFHSIFPAIGIWALFHFTGYDIIGIPLAVGYLAHLLSDCLTRMGCNLLYPITTLRIRGPIMTNGAMEYAVFFIMIALNLFFVVKNFV